MMPSLKSKARLPKVHVSVSNPFDESLLTTNFERDITHEASVLPSKNNLSLLPSASRAFQIITTFVLFVVLLTCATFFQHSTTMARLRGGEVRFYRRKRLTMASDATGMTTTKLLPVVYVQDNNNQESIIQELSSYVLVRNIEETKSEEDTTDIPDNLLEDTVNGVIDDLYSANTADADMN